MKKSNFWLAFIVLASYQTSVLGENISNPIPPEKMEFPQITDTDRYMEEGPCGEVVINRKDGPKEAFTTFVPKNIQDNGYLHPVITWGNGTGGNPMDYAGLLSHLASHCFVVIASNSSNTGTGRQMIDGALWMQTDGPDIFGDGLRADLIAASGHSQGGGGSLNTAASDELTIKALVPMMPDCRYTSRCRGLSKITAPTFVYTGSLDTIVADWAVNSGVVQNLKSVDYLFYATHLGRGHMDPVGSSAPDSAIEFVAFYRAVLMGDQQAKQLFTGTTCKLCDQSGWRVRNSFEPL